MSQRVEGLEGVRGLAAFWVFTHHFILIFYPVFYFGQHTWLNHILNPDLAVTWFFVHSGYVLAYKGSHLEGKAYYKNLLGQIIRRYFRLLPIVLFSILLTLLFFKLNFIHNRTYGVMVNSSWLSRYLNFSPDFFEAIKQSFFGVYFSFKSATTYNPNLWTIGYELISSYLLFVILGILGPHKKAAPIFIVLAFVIGPWKGMMSFLFGAFLTRLPKHKAHPFLIGFFTLAGFYLSDLKGVYEPHARSIGATFIMYALIQSPNIRSFLNFRFFQFLGNISYSLYAIHFLLLASLTSFLGIYWQAHLNISYVLLVYLITTVTLFILSYLTWNFIDKPGIALAKKIAAKLINVENLT
jgi:peptidoglycan/LPS O-acetylase OafA/YrhL